MKPLCLNLRYAFAAMVALCTALRAADETATVEKLTYKQVPTATKAKDRDLTFCLTFDKKSVAATMAKGDADSSTFGDGNLEFRLIPGFDGQNAYNRSKGEVLNYDVTKNIDHRQGTISFWIMAKDYSPKDVKVSDPVKTHKPYVYVYLKNGKEWVRLFFYQYFNDTRGFFYWSNSYGGPRDYKLAAVSLNAVGQGQWVQLAATWDDTQIRSYLNGKLVNTVLLPPEATRTDNLVPDPKESFIGVRQCLWANAEEVGETVIDDLKIYSRPLAEVEIQRQYQALVASQETVALPAFGVQLDGVDDLGGPLDRLEVLVDLNPLADNWRTLIGKGQVAGTITRTAPDGTASTAPLKIDGLKPRHVTPGVTQPGKHSVTVALTAPDGRAISASRDFVRPETSWFGNTLGAEDQTPSPWNRPTIDAKNTVTVWGRTYRFDNSPLPTEVKHTGQSLLTAPPQLLIDTPAGRGRIRYTITGRKQTNTYVELTSEGKADGFTVRGTTRIEFDGFIRWDFTIHGEPTINSMKMVWTVAPEFSKYLLAPLLEHNDTGVYEFPFPTRDRASNYQLWLTSETKGFCWSPEHDANWRNAAGEKPLRVRVTPEGGACEAAMITQPSKLPEGTSYHAMFIATPSRPLPEHARTYRLGGYGRQSNCDVALISHAGAGLESVFTFKPEEKDNYFEKWIDQLAKQNMSKLAVYGGACTLNDHAAEGKYFGRYWDIPGGPAVPFIDKRRKPPLRCMQTSACPRTSYSDYILRNLKLLFDHPKGEAIHAIYYDIAGITTCASTLHGCRFTDRFGRDVSRLTIMGLRRHLRRTTQYCHERGRTTIWHAHSYFSPMVHALGDYWFPGEQYASLIMREQTPYVYSDVIPDAVYRSELNMHLRGSGILFLPQLSRADRRYGTPEQTLAALTKLLLNDIPISMAYVDEGIVNTIWGIGLKYDLDQAKAHPWDVQKLVTTDNPGTAATVFACPDDRYLVIVGNMTKEPQNVTVDLSALKPPATVTEEYLGKPLLAPDGKVSLSLDPRHFRIIGW